MPRKIYIDAYNVLRKHPRFSALLRSNADAARRDLVAAIGGAYGGRSELVVVFDGHGEPIEAGNRLLVVFTGARSADAWIRMTLEAARRLSDALVVSSDIEVARHARAMGAEIQRSEDFLTALRRHADRTDDGMDRNRKLSDGEIQEWLDLFSGSDP